MLENETQVKDAHTVETFHRKPKILILGHGRHGKDTAAKIISEVCDISFVSSSWAALDAIYPALKITTGIDSKIELYNRRHENRELWKSLIGLYNTPDKTALTKHILSKNDMYVGMRCKDEYEHSKILFDHVFWVDRSNIETVDKSMSIEYNPETMIMIDNNGTLDELKVNIKGACDSVFNTE